MQHLAAEISRVTRPKTVKMFFKKFFSFALLTIVASQQQKQNVRRNGNPKKASSNQMQTIIDSRILQPAESSQKSPNHDGMRQRKKDSGMAFRAIVTYSTETGRQLVEKLCSKVYHDFPADNAIAVELNMTSFELLRAQTSDIVSVEQDSVWQSQGYLEEARKKAKEEAKLRKKAMEAEQNALFGEALLAVEKKSTTNQKFGKVEAKGRDADDADNKKTTSRAMKMMYQMDAKEVSEKLKEDVRESRVTHAVGLCDG